MVSPTIGQRSRNRVKMVYQHHATQFGNSRRDCQMPRHRCEGFIVVNKMIIKNDDNNNFSQIRT